MSIESLVEVSNKYGKNTDYVLAGGGNTSYKNENYLYIKGSGTKLGTIKADGFVKMSRCNLLKMFNKQYSENTDERETQVLTDLMNSREPEEVSKRPSVETLLHDLFPQTFVVHTHPALANGLTCSVKGEEYAKKLFGSHTIWIEPTMPGYVLAVKVKEKIENYTKAHSAPPEIIFLENHGIFVAANDTEGIDRIMNMVMNKLNQSIVKQYDFTPIKFSHSKMEEIKKQLNEVMLGEDGRKILFDTNKDVQFFVQSEENFVPVSYAYTPDHMVYYKHSPLFIKDGETIVDRIHDFLIKYGFLPKVIAYEGLGFFSLGNNIKDAEIIQALFLDTVKIAVYSQSFGGYKFMPEFLVDFINNWEVERYRKNVNKKETENPKHQINYN